MYIFVEVQWNVFFSKWLFIQRSLGYVFACFGVSKATVESTSCPIGSLDYSEHNQVSYTYHNISYIHTINTVQCHEISLNQSKSV